ncbi:hypothetical protein BZA05DRAFT_401456 [Tricharina praecox]|uniref:uncharacterized protein n=1 Tax=Tricharina praecox TaxID=43433 RepID=UPI00221FD92F|nr:uncharacterized protein BZA05DRAFT_401456 [Tricharina praecox]KAI5849757.1 hypothetical protein BZA05DRAFT_401456 [Tricharina praecox]
MTNCRSCPIDRGRVEAVAHARSFCSRERERYASRQADRQWVVPRQILDRVLLLLEGMELVELVGLWACGACGAWSVGIDKRMEILIGSSSSGNSSRSKVDFILDVTSSVMVVVMGGPELHCGRWLDGYRLVEYETGVWVERGLPQPQPRTLVDVGWMD